VSGVVDVEVGDGWRQQGEDERWRGDGGWVEWQRGDASVGS
jgi:hypothetical protein